MTSLDQQLAALAERHNLLSVSLDYLRSDDGSHASYHAGLQWKDEARPHGRAVATAHADSMTTALQLASTKMAEMRGPAIDQLTPLEIAA